MGSSKPRDQATMTASTAGAQASDASLAKQADQSTAYAKQAHDTLFGTGTTSQGAAGIGQGGGTLSKFLDPNSLNVSSPTGAYGLQYNKATENIANQGAQDRGAIARGFASRGFGNMPSGFVADQSRQQLADQSNQQGAAFTDLAGKSYADSLNNFWNATNIASGSGAANTNAAIAADSSAANNYSNLYGVASTPKPNTAAALAGAAIQGGAQIGAGAAACPCAGSRILMMDGTEKAIEDCHKGDVFKGFDNEPCLLYENPEEIEAECVEVSSGRYKNRVSEDHSYILSRGGYDLASNIQGKRVFFSGTDKYSVDIVDSVIPIGKHTVFVIKISGSHSYRVDGIWSLS